MLINSITIIVIHKIHESLLYSTENVEPRPKPKKILDTIIAPGYIPAEEKHGSYWKKSAVNTLREKLKETPNINKAKNGILFIGDGMSLATVMAARTFAGQLDRGLGEDSNLEFENFPVSGLAKVSVKNSLFKLYA